MLVFFLFIDSLPQGKISGICSLSLHHRNFVTVNLAEQDLKGLKLKRRIIERFADI